MTIWSMDKSEETPEYRRTESSGNVAGNQTRSAGEMGTAVNTEKSAGAGSRVEVVVGEIPDAEDLTRMLWTARCTDAGHGLLGTFAQQTEAEECRKQHLVGDHGQTGSG